MYSFSRFVPTLTPVLPATALLTLSFTWTVPRPSEVHPAAHGTTDLDSYLSVGLPYHGFGSATVFREGVIHFTVGGELLGYDDDGTLRQTESETLSIRLASNRGIALVSKKQQWRLESADCVDQPDEVRPLDAETSSHHQGLVGLLHLTGSLFIGRDDASDAWSFEVLDLETGDSFAFLYRPDPKSNPTALRAAALAQCMSGPCPLGDCTITCNPPLLCQAGCGNGGEPICKCILLMPVPEPPLPIPPRRA